MSKERNRESLGKDESLSNICIDCKSKFIPKMLKYRLSFGAGDEKAVGKSLMGMPPLSFCAFEEGP